MAGPHLRRDPAPGTSGPWSTGALAGGAQACGAAYGSARRSRLPTRRSGPTRRSEFARRSRGPRRRSLENRKNSEAHARHRYSLRMPCLVCEETPKGQNIGATALRAEALARFFGWRTRLWHGRTLPATPRSLARWPEQPGPDRLDEESRAVLAGFPPAVRPVVDASTGWRRLRGSVCRRDRSVDRSRESNATSGCSS
jgi:hypothetical protein